VNFVKLDFSDERVLAVVAHPDDAEILCAGTLVRALADGASIGIAVLCKGDRGQPQDPIPELGGVRREEMTVAAKLLGAQLFLGEVSDGSLSDEVGVRLELTEVFRKFESTLVLAHDPADYHPDHQAASRIAQAASWYCASKGHETSSPPTPGPPALWFMDSVQMLGFEPGFYVDVSAQMDLKRAMLRCHESQLARGAELPPLAQTMELQARVRGMQAGVEHAEAFRIAPLMKRIRAW
jgi:LmbE family N-acetylglucosaminyl deacetylase